MNRTLYACQKCGEEVGEGEQDYRGRHQNCGGSLDPIGECNDEPVVQSESANEACQIES